MTLTAGSAEREAHANKVLINRAWMALSFVDFLNYSFHVEESHAGVVLYATYMDADIYTDKAELQYTRKWPLTPAMTKSEIIQTAFKCCMTSMEHRTREAFKYKGARVFGPHFDIEDLVRLCQGREDAGARVPVQPQKPTPPGAVMKDEYFAGVAVSDNH
jgi:hypothetical protein